MKLNELSPNPGSTHRRKRVGRGESSGLGKTSGRGSNGQKSRAGGGVRPGFEGGQMPFIRRIGKRGFSNARFKKEYAIVSISTLNDRFEANEEISATTLVEKKIIKKVNDGIKVLANGDVTKPLNLKVTKISISAKEKIENAGGKVEIL